MQGGATKRGGAGERGEAETCCYTYDKVALDQAMFHSRHWVILILLIWCGLNWELETEDDKIVFIASGADRVEMITTT